MANVSQGLVAAGEALARNGFAAIPRAAIIDFTGKDALVGLDSQWSDLAVDAYLPGGGTFRRRRYGRLLVEPRDDNSIRTTALPPAPFTQTSQTIPLYNGRPRRFAPIDAATLTSGPLLALLRLDLDVIAAVESRPYQVGIHMIRVEADVERAAPPAPEGRHQDGHLFVAMHLIKRDACAGGTSLIFRPADQDPLAEITLTDRFDTLVINDRRVEHDVTPIRATAAHGIRDMLLLDFDLADEHYRTARGTRP